MIKHCGIGRNNGLDTANHFLQFLFSGEKLMGWSQKKDHHRMENLYKCIFSLSLWLTLYSGTLTRL